MTNVLTRFHSTFVGAETRENRWKEQKNNKNEAGTETMNDVNRSELKRSIVHV
jgi:hypothetical protein